MSFDLTNKNIENTFQNLLQRTGSDNHLYDLKGNKIGDLRISGSLIANQYIVSSSVTNITTQQLSGSTEFGDSTDDTHTFTGNITASGDISSSGTIVGSNLSGTNTGDQDLSGLAVIDGGAISENNFAIGSDGSTAITDSPVSLKNSDKDFAMGTLNISSSGNIKHINHITASGNISSSGDVIGGNLFTDGFVSASGTGGTNKFGSAIQFQGSLSGIASDGTTTHTLFIPQNNL